MKYLYTDLFNEFECIGGECPETCCGTWTISIDNKSLLISRLSRVLEHSSMMDILTNLLIEKNGKESVYGILDFFEEG